MCFRSAYLSVMLQKVMGWTASTPIQVASESISWPIGAARMEVEKQLSQRAKLRKQRRSFFFKFGCVFIVLSSILTLCIRFWRRRRRSLSDAKFEDIEIHSPSLRIFRHRGHGVKRRTLSYRRLQDLTPP